MSAPLHLPAMRRGRDTLGVHDPMEPNDVQTQWSGVADPTGAGDTVAAVFTLVAFGRGELPGGRRPGQSRGRGGGRQGGYGNGVFR